jgi:hypothetical protein
MGRLVAFDQQTASSLVARTRTAAQLGHGSPLRAALATEDEATLLMPGSQRDQLLVVSVRRQPARATLASKPPAVVTPPAVAPSVVSTPRPRVEEKREEVKRDEAKAAMPAPPKQATPAPPPANNPPPTTLPSVEKPASSTTVDDMEPVGYEATGFLGLENSPVYAHDLEAQARQAKKKWWQKLLD